LRFFGFINVATRGLTVVATGFFVGAGVETAVGFLVVPLAPLALNPLPDGAVDPLPDGAGAPELLGAATAAPVSTGGGAATSGGSVGIGIGVGVHSCATDRVGVGAPVSFLIPPHPIPKALSTSEPPRSKQLTTRIVATNQYPMPAGFSSDSCFSAT